VLVLLIGVEDAETGVDFLLRAQLFEMVQQLFLAFKNRVFHCLH